MEVLQINIETQIFQNKILKQQLNSFVLNYNKINYLISLHHFLPINKLYNNLNNEELTIKINSCWSEVLVINTLNLDLENLIINYKIQNRLPKQSDIVYIKTNERNYSMDVVDYELIPFNNINIDFTVPYIKCKIDQDVKVLLGLSGSPVIMNDKIIGMFSKFNEKESIAYVIPIYIIIKNLIKEDNYNIYGLPKLIIPNINKINSYNVKNNYIYHPSLKINVPINTFLIIEGDLKTKLIIKSDIIAEIITIPIITNISNEISIVNKEYKYKINSRLLNLLKNLNVNKQIIIYLFNYINKSTDLNDLWITLKPKN